MTIILRTASEFHWLKESSPQAQISLEHGSYNFRQTNFKDFSRTKIYLINRHSLTPFDHPVGKISHGVIYNYSYFFGLR